MSAFYDMCLLLGEDDKDQHTIGDNSGYFVPGPRLLHPKLRRKLNQYFTPRPARAWWIHSINYARYTCTEARRLDIWIESRKKALDKVEHIQNLTSYLKALRVEQEAYGVHDVTSVYKALNFLIQFKPSENSATGLSLYIPPLDDPELSYSFLNLVDPDLLVEANLKKFYPSSLESKPGSPVHFDASDELLETGSYCSRRSFHSGSGCDEDDDHHTSYDEEDLRTSYTAGSHEYTIEAPTIGEEGEEREEEYVLNKRQVANSLNAPPISAEEFKRSNDILRDMLRRLESRSDSRTKNPDNFVPDDSSERLPWYMKHLDQSSFDSVLEDLSFMSAEPKDQLLHEENEDDEDNATMDDKHEGDIGDESKVVVDISAPLIPSPLYPTQFRGTIAKKDRVIFDKRVTRQEMEEMMKKEREEGIKRHKKKMLLLKAEKRMKKIEAMGPVVNVDELLVNNEPKLTPQEEERRQEIRRAKEAIKKIRLELSAGDPRAPYKEYSKTEQKLLESPFAQNIVKKVFRNLGVKDEVLNPHSYMTPAQRKKMADKKRARDKELGIQASAKSMSIKMKLIARK